MDHLYHWTSKDKWLYVLSLIPFVLLLLGTGFILFSYSVYLLVVWIALYFVLNIFQAGCCVGCPYRGKYCPAFVGVYLGNCLSRLLYPKRRSDEKFFKRNAMGGEITLSAFFLFPVYWLVIKYPFNLFVYVVLIFMHILLFMPLQCSKCSYNNTCPGGKAYRTWCRVLNKKKNIQ